MAGDFANYIDDPYVDSENNREPLNDETEIIIIGGGFGGLIAGARLRDAGFYDVRIIEKGGDFGGTWYWNRYPGAACDTEAYIYLPLCEELGVVPTQKYAQGPEIRAHSQRIAKHYDLHDNACLQTEVIIHWEETTAMGHQTNHDDTMRAARIMSTGPINRPKLSEFQASRITKVTLFIPVAGIINTPAVDLRAILPTFTTSEWPLSAQRPQSNVSHLAHCRDTLRFRELLLNRYPR